MILIPKLWALLHTCSRLSVDKDGEDLVCITHITVWCGDCHVQETCLGSMVYMVRIVCLETRDQSTVTYPQRGASHTEAVDSTGIEPESKITK